MQANSNSSTPVGSLSRSASFNQAGPFPIVGSPPQLVTLTPNGPMPTGQPQPQPGLMSQAALVTLAPPPMPQPQMLGQGQVLPPSLGQAVGQGSPVQGMVTQIGGTPPGANTPPGAHTPVQQHLQPVQAMPIQAATSSPVLQGQQAFHIQPHPGFVQHPGQPGTFFPAQVPLPAAHPQGVPMPVFNILNSPPATAFPAQTARPSVAATSAGPTAKANTAQRVHVPAVKPKVDPADVGPRQLIINHLSRQVTEAELFHVFDQIGPVQCAKLILDKDTQRTRGYGFVYFASSTDAANAVKALNSTMLLGKEIQVGFANPQRPLYDTPEASQEILNKEIENLRKAGLPTQ